MVYAEHYALASSWNCVALSLNSVESVRMLGLTVPPLSFVSSQELIRSLILLFEAENFKYEGPIRLQGISLKKRTFHCLLTQKRRERGF
jgi:hypothetical protein